MADSLSGQWLGTATSEVTNGTFLLDLDRIEDHYEGWAYIWDSEPAKPGFMAWVKTMGLGPSEVIQVRVQTIDPRTGVPMTTEQATAAFGAELPVTATAAFRLDGDSLQVEATTNIGTTLQATAPRSQANQKSNLVPRPDVTTWSSFKGHIAQYDRREALFRGQRETRRLRTSFHRGGRADLRRFILHDIPELRRSLSSRTKHIFNLENREEYGAFISLAQHHGYPTPLLDWTASPYIAAFFAYRKHCEHPVAASGTDDKVRIFVFNVKEWMRDFPQLSVIVPTGPHFSVLALLAIENDRLVPQQSVSTVTNLDDIETYLLDAGARTGHQYLEAVDLPLSERGAVIRDLAFMGITAGSMMPGLDGACEELRDVNFPENLSET